MTTGSHLEPNGEIALFFADDPRQVWVRNHNGDPTYIEIGTAEALRTEQHAHRATHGTDHWHCIDKTCQTKITFRGTTRTRDHYAHEGDYSHPGSGESANHLAAKAMLCHWANTLQGVTAKEEVHVPGRAHMSTYRVADVMATIPEAIEVALEVEYKDFDPDDWELTDDDLKIAGVTASWLLGHSRLAARTPNNPSTDGPTEVALTRLARAMARRGNPVLAVNPETRQVATVAATPEFDRALTGTNTYGYLALDDLADCELTPDGIATPALRRLEHNIALRVAKEAEAATETARQAELERQRREAEAEQEAERQRRYQAAIERREQAWQASEIRQKMDQFNPHPTALTRFDRHTAKYIKAHAPHWQGAIYFSLIHEQPGRTFGTGDCWRALAQEDIEPDWNQKNAKHALFKFLDSLSHNGLITKTAPYTWTVVKDLNGNKAPAPATQAPTPPPPPPSTPPIHPAVRVTSTFIRVPVHIDPTAAQLAARWNQSPLKTEAIETFGTIPSHVIQPVEPRIAFNADYLEWRTFIVLKLVNSPNHAPLTTDRAIEALAEAGYVPTAHAHAAVTDYLAHLARIKMTRT